MGPLERERLTPTEYMGENLEHTNEDWIILVWEAVAGMGQSLKSSICAGPRTVGGERAHCGTCREIKVFHYDAVTMVDIGGSGAV